MGKFAATAGPSKFRTGGLHSWWMIGHGYLIPELKKVPEENGISKREAQVLGNTNKINQNLKTKIVGQADRCEVGEQSRGRREESTKREGKSAQRDNLEDRDNGPSL